MENKDKIKIGYLEVFSWEHFSATNSRFCFDIDQLEWILPDETTDELNKFLSLWQETLLQDCTPLTPLRDSGNKKRKIYIKSKSFRKRLKNESIDFFKQLRGGMWMFNNIGDPIEGAGPLFFSQYVEHLKFSDLNANWDEYVFKNSGYSPGFNSSKENKFYVPKSDEKIIDYYSVHWRQHFFEDKIFDKIFDHDFQ